MAKHYGQYCPVAHALELVGERWSLLVVRELLGGPKRYTDLAGALPGIGTNILANRLRELEGAGVIEKRRLPPPAAANVYALTEYGEELREPLYALGRWGARSLGPPAAADNLAPGWLVNAVRATCQGCVSDKVYELRIDDEAVTARFVDDELLVQAGSSPDADTVIETDPTTLFCIASREVSIKESLDAGTLEITGKRSEAERFLSSLSFETRSRELEHV
jgi:DNA-binding HxlR family transcriptional regulator